MKKIKAFLLSVLMLLTLSTTAKAEFFSDVIVTGTNAIWTDSRAYANLPAAINAVGALQRTIVIASQQSVGNMTIPANVTLKFERDGAIIHSGQLTFNTRNIIAENRQILAGAGDVDFASGTTVKSSWFATFESAVDLTSDDTVTLVVTKAQTLTTSETLGNNVILKWESPGNILTANAGVIIDNIGQIEAPNCQILAGAGTFSFRDGPILNLAWFPHLRSAITWIAASKVVLEVNVSSPVAYTDSVPSNIQLKINRGGNLTIAGGQILTITNAKQVDIGPYYFDPFAGAGSVTITGGLTYTPATTLTGAALRLLYLYQANLVNYEVDALYDYGGGTSYTQATIEAALTAIGTSNKTTLILRPGTWVINADADWSAYTNVTFKIVPGAILTGSFTVTFPRNNIDAMDCQIFDSTLTVSGLGKVFVNWFGAVPGALGVAATNSLAIAKAILATSTGGEFNLSPGLYYSVSGAEAVVFDKSITIRFNGSYLDYGAGTGTCVRFGSASGVSEVGDITAHDVDVRGTGTGIGVLIQNLYRSRFMNGPRAVISGASGTGMKITAAGGKGTYFNEYYGAKLYNSHINLLLDMAVHADNYVTHQVFYGGNIYGTLPTAAGSRGVEITATNAANHAISKILFYGTAIEPIVGTTTGRKLLDAGVGNLYDSITWDATMGAPGTDIEFTADSLLCEIRGGLNTYIQRITNSGTNNWISGPGYGISTGATLTLRSTDAYLKMDSAGVFEEGTNLVKRKSVKIAAVADDGTINLPTLTGTAAMLLVSASQDGGAGAESGFFIVSNDGSVKKVAGTTNTAITSSDGSLCVVDGGTRAQVINKLGYIATIVYTLIYF